MFDLLRLSDYFPAEDIEWKPITISKKTSKGLAAAYITNRAIMQRLDDVCGPGNWRNQYAPGPEGGVICGLSIRIDRAEDGPEWVTKWDGAENTDIEAVKGGLSNAMRRAAVQWGIGRYLYDLPSQWVDVDEKGRFLKTPQVPSKYLPGKNHQASNGHTRQDAKATAHPVSPGLSPKDYLFECADHFGIADADVHAAARHYYPDAETLNDLSHDAVEDLVNRMAAKAGAFKQ